MRCTQMITTGILQQQQYHIMGVRRGFGCVSRDLANLFSIRLSWRVSARWPGGAEGQRSLVRASGRLLSSSWCDGKTVSARRERSERRGQTRTHQCLSGLYHHLTWSLLEAALVCLFSCFSVCLMAILLTLLSGCQINICHLTIRPIKLSKDLCFIQ